MRTSDAVPDELEIVPEGTRSRSSSVDERPGSQSSSRRVSVPKMIVEKIDPASRSHGEVPGTEAHAMRQADAEPDEILKAPEQSTSQGNGMPTKSMLRSGSDELNRSTPDSSRHDESVDGDDFDDFAEGDESLEDEFGDFDEGDQATQTQSSPAQAPAAVTKLPLLDIDALDTHDDFNDACAPFIERIFPEVTSQSDTQVPPLANSFLNERSHSLWSQLVAPPAVQPPNWLRSRTRRLFLVSLGVPVNLDEILPASKQKKLVLPSIDVEQERSARSRDEGPVGAATRLKQQDVSANSGTRSSSRSEKRRKGPPPPPVFDENDARLACSTTSEALTNLSDDELEAHKEKLEQLKKKASEALEYWLIQRDSANGDKEAFEEVIQNLVKHAQKIRT
ncbi:MAG: hypothetical protein Q9162_001547 [Coniocarpon cinnabarinum]